MKMIRKMISLLLVTAMLLSASAAAMAVDISASDDVQLTGMSTASVTQAVQNYFEARADYLLGKVTTMDWPNVGIVNDEAAHILQYNAKNIVLNETNYTIETIACYDNISEVDALETISYTKNGIANTEVVAHKLRLYLGDANAPIVAADGYMELCSGFESCSYLPPDTTMTRSTSNGGSSLCIVEVAKGEVGTEATGNKMTKYGEWFGSNGVDWCAIFVAWCANEAKVSTSIVPSYAGCGDVMRFFRDQDRLYLSPSQNGEYTPVPGDIIIFSSTPGLYRHVGIVEKVENGKVWIIDGNCNNKVCHRAINLNASDIYGYGNPDYESSGHVFSGYITDADHHWQECVNCGYTSQKIVHIAGNYSYDTSSHWKNCRICELELERAAHVLVLNPDGSYKCQLCDCPHVAIGLWKLRRCLEE